MASPPDPAWVEGSSWRPPGAGDHHGGGRGMGGHTQTAVFTSFALQTVMTVVTYEVSAKSWSKMLFERT